MNSKGKLSKAELAEIVAKALNLLMTLHASADDGLQGKDADNLHQIANLLPFDLKASYWNNGTMLAKDFI